MSKGYGKLILTGVAVGLVAIALTLAGNPANMAFCIACFLRDMAGGLGLHRAEVVQYVRPEIIGIVLGALVMALVSKEYASKGGSAPVTRFVLGACVMVGALMFLGCPLRMLLRIAGGDWNALVGLGGFVVGIATGVLFLNKGFSLDRTYTLSAGEGMVFPAINVLLLVLLVAAPTLLLFSEKGPGSMRAPIWIALTAGLAVGVLAQKTRLCFISGIRDAMLFRDFRMVFCFVALVITVLIGNLLTDRFVPGFAGQPVAHTDGLWNFLGLYLVGLGSVMLGGCPLRQLVLAGSGNSDSAVAVLGMVVGAAFCHNFKLASSADGPTPNGKAAFVLCLAVTIGIAVWHTVRKRTALKSAKGDMVHEANH